MREACELRDDASCHLCECDVDAGEDGNEGNGETEPNVTIPVTKGRALRQGQTSPESEVGCLSRSFSLFRVLPMEGSHIVGRESKVNSPGTCPHRWKIPLTNGSPATVTVAR
jgi:hypothetical protein